MRRPEPADPADNLPVSAGYARALLRRFGATPGERAALLAGSGVDERLIDAPGAKLPLSTLLRVVANVARFRGEDWPIDAQQVWSTAMHGAIDVAARSASTVGDALSILAKFGPVRAPFLKVRHQPTRNAICLVFTPSLEVDSAVWRGLALSTALSVHAMLRQMLDDKSTDITVTFPWAASNNIASLRSALQCNIEFDAGEFSIVLPKAFASLASPFTDPALCASAVEELELAARRIAGEDTLVLELRQLFAQRLPVRLSEAAAAESLALSRRSLVRRLTASERSYRSLLDDYLRERARSMIADGSMSREEMAAALGYADPTSFSRACRRWFSAS